MAGCRGSLCCCCRWCCCCGERETRTPEELVRSGRSPSGEGEVAKGRREALPGGGAGPSWGRRWQRVGPGHRNLGSQKHLPRFPCPTLGSFLISPPWNLRENPGPVQLIPSMFSFISM